MSNDRSDARSRILEIFDVVPVLKLTCAKVPEFTYPKMEARSQSVPAHDATLDYSSHKKRKKNASAGPVEKLRDGIEEAAQKLRFGDTSNDDWKDLLLFSGDRLSSAKPFDKQRAAVAAWNEGEVINSSPDAFEDWFQNHFLEVVAAGGGERHSQALTGSPGSGKSTLIKYAMSHYSSHLDYLGIVMSRFEFLKFWADWHEIGEDISQSLRNYLSFIQCRDLVISHFFEFRNGNQLVIRPQFSDQENLEREVSGLATEMHLRARVLKLGHEPHDFEKARCVMILSEAVARAKQNNSELMKWVRRLSVNDRILMINVLWGDKNLVTVFDGLDSLNVEDAFQETPEWEAVERIVFNRSNLCKPSIFREEGIAVKADSLIIVRKNTLALLKSKLREKRKRMGIARVHQVGSIDGFSAIVAVAARSCRFIPDVVDQDLEGQEAFVEAVVTVVQRTLLAISKRDGTDVATELVYGVFDGNLRELFAFVARIVHRSLNDMLGMNLIDGDTLFGSTAVLANRAVEVGDDYLEHKSYQIVEMFLYDGLRFENVLRTVGSRSKEFPSATGAPVIQKNEQCHGYVDNLFTYHFRGPAENLDGHPLIEKIRVLQCLENQPLTGDELRAELQTRFGYEPPEFRTLLLFLLKSDLITAEIVPVEDDYDFRYRCTPRALLSMHSLIENLAYVENVFHRTRLPSDLIGHVSDPPKSETNTESWAARAINNAFILLCYLRHVEQNKAGGVSAGGEDQIFQRIHEGITRSVRRMLRVTPDGRRLNPPKDPDALKKFKSRELAAARIATDAHHLLSVTYSAWRSKTLVPPSQVINLLELDLYSSRSTSPSQEKHS